MVARLLLLASPRSTRGPSWHVAPLVVGAVQTCSQWGASAPIRIRRAPVAWPEPFLASRERELQDVQRQARLYTLIDEVYRDRDAANKDEIIRKLEELGLADSVRDLLPLPDGPIPRPALAIAVDRVIAGVTGPAVWERQSNPADVANPTEPEGGVTYGTSEVGTAGVVE